MPSRVDHTFVDGVEGKVCTKCSEWRPLDGYNNSKNKWDKRSSQCKICIRKSSVAYYKAHPDYRRAHSAAFRAARADYCRAYNRSPKGRLSQRRSNFKSSYGITLEQLDEMIASQEGRCPICGCELVVGGKSRNSACVDHNYATGKARGILCLLCNAMLGLAADNSETLRAGADYLETHNEPE
jgi:hypothetical protein